MVRLYGFSAKERLFWKDTLPGCQVVEKGGTAQVLLIAGDCCNAEASPTPSEINEAGVACVVTSWGGYRRWRSVLKSSFPIIKEYGLLPAADPRVVIPLSLSRHTVAALGLHSPGRTLARIAVFLARSLAMVGNKTLLRRRVLFVATRQPKLYPRGLAEGSHWVDFNDMYLDYALYLGRADDDRKTVVLPLGASGPDTILKVASSVKARESLVREASTLEILGESPLSRCIPRLLHAVDSGGAITVYQEYRPRLRISQRRMDAGVVSFLGQLSFLGRQRRTLCTFLSEFPINLNMACNSFAMYRELRTRLQELAESGAEIWVHRRHGDFAPWNCTWTDDGLFVFDWEASCEEDLAFSDVFYYAVSPYMTVNDRYGDAMGTVKRALSLAQQVASLGRMEDVNLYIYFAIWILRWPNQARLNEILCALLRGEWYTQPVTE